MNEIKSKNGVTVRLTEEKWFHVTEEHSEMASCMSFPRRRESREQKKKNGFPINTLGNDRYCGYPIKDFRDDKN